MVVATLGLWGCAQEHRNGPGSARLKALESKNAKLQNDFRAVVAARDQMRKKLIAAEEQKVRLSQQLEEIQAITRERDELRQQVTSRTSERDAIQNQFDQFRKGIRSLLGQADTFSANSQPGQPVTSTVKTPAGEKS
jgi:chromosome segregation ATPase